MIYDFDPDASGYVAEAWQIRKKRTGDGARLSRSPRPRFLEMRDAVSASRHGILCLISALELHGVIRDVRSRPLWIALPSKARVSTKLPANVRVVRFSEEALAEGLQEVVIRGHGTIKTFSPAKSIVDCFKFRNTLFKELDMDLPELMDYLQSMVGAYGRRTITTIESIRQYLPACRMNNVMSPYLLALEHRNREQQGKCTATPVLPR